MSLDLDSLNAQVAAQLLAEGVLFAKTAWTDLGGAAGAGPQKLSVLTGALDDGTPFWVLADEYPHRSGRVVTLLREIMWREPVQRIKMHDPPPLPETKGKATGKAPR